MAPQLLMIGGLIFVMMGVVHGGLALVDVFRPKQFAPVDDRVRLAMRSTNVRFLRARANMWDAWLGFNLSHGLGMVIFGAATFGFGLNNATIAVWDVIWAIPFAVALVYFVL